tara:strand:+ start:113 stop:949 length:837 start_codon:yes stop_codon:yes gene_type:complete
MPANHPSVSTSAIVRLTEKERECLRLWLEHKTAKEIALDLGISHHAVEKRLKMARTKLDVATSLEAARALAEAEGYEQIVTGSSELSSGTGDQHVAASAALPSGTREWRRRSLLVPGAIIMSIIIAALAFAATQQISGHVGSRTLATGDEITGRAGGGAIDADSGTQEHDGEIRGNGEMGTASATPDYATVYARAGGNPDQTVKRTFSVLDDDNSGVIDASEVRTARFVVVQRKASGQGDPDMEELAEADRDTDGRITLAEYRTWLMPMIDAAARGAS